MIGQCECKPDVVWMRQACLITEVYRKSARNIQDAYLSARSSATLETTANRWHVATSVGTTSAARSMSFVPITTTYWHRAGVTQPTLYRRYRRLATSWNAIPAASVRRSVVRTVFVRRPVHRTYRPCRFAVATDRRTTTSASSGCTLVVIRRTWSRRPSATAEVGSLNVRRTGRLIFCITKLN